MSESIGPDAEVSLRWGVSCFSSYNTYDQPISDRSKANRNTLEGQSSQLIEIPGHTKRQIACSRFFRRQGVVSENSAMNGLNDLRSCCSQRYADVTNLQIRAAGPDWSFGCHEEHESAARGLAESRGLTHNFRRCCAVENRSAVMSESQLWGASYLLPL